MKRLKVIFLSWLLHHGNRYRKHANFYKLKTEVLKKYASLVGYEYQFIIGNECWSCEGTGIFHKYYFFDKRPTKETCYKCCGTGMYTNDHWNVLAVYKFGKYTFHSPLDRQYIKPPVGSKIIQGYITHNISYWSRFAQCAIFILFDLDGYGSRWTFEMGIGKRNWSWRPASIINNIAYIRYHIKDYLPQKRFVFDNEDLPF